MKTATGGPSPAQIAGARHIPATATAGANTAVTITVAAVADHQWILTALDIGFDGAPVCTVTVVIGSTTVWDQDFAGVGPFHFDWPGGKMNGTTKNEAMVVTASAPGAGVIANLNINYV